MPTVSDVMLIASPSRSDASKLISSMSFSITVCKRLARRLHTVMEKLMEEISFDASERDGEAISITSETVGKNVADLAKNADVRKFIL